MSKLDIILSFTIDMILYCEWNTVELNATQSNETGEETGQVKGQTQQLN